MLFILMSYSLLNWGKHCGKVGNNEIRQSRERNERDATGYYKSNTYM